MKISYNKNRKTYALLELSEYQMMLIGTALSNENTRLSMLEQLSDEQFREIILTDAGFLNAAASQRAVDVDALTEELSDPEQLRKLRSGSQFGKNCRAMNQLCAQYMEGQKKLLNDINFDVKI